MSTGSEQASRAEPSVPNDIVKSFLLEREQVFRELVALKSKGWEDSDADRRFSDLQRQYSQGVDQQRQPKFFRMYQEIADELQARTGVLSRNFGNHGPKVLDLCMAPGGYTSAVLQHNAAAQVYGISLSESQGGHELLIKSEPQDPRVRVRFLDITMLSTEFGTTSIPPGHPDKDNFLTCRPYSEHEFDLVFCDGSVLSSHIRQSYRQNHREIFRLLYAQLILALQRIKPGGVLVMMLHKLDGWDTVQLLRSFSKFAKVELFKSVRKHAARGSFYLVAKDVQPRDIEAIKATVMWKQLWWLATFGGDDGVGGEDVADVKAIKDLLDSFGATLIGMAKPIWKIQAEALGKKGYGE